MKENQRTWAEVNLDHIQYNLGLVRRFVGPQTKIMSVVKADAYGHGFLEVCKALIESGTDYLAVACIDEAIQLRHHKIDLPVLILGYTPNDRAEELIRYDICPTVYNMEFALALSQAAQRMGKSSRVHIKIDTGMARIGFLYGYSPEMNEKTLANIQELCRLPFLTVEGIFTHFSNADDETDELTLAQFEKFMALNQQLAGLGIEIPIKHCCNSAATMRYPQMHLDMVRPGIILYGCYPSEFCHCDGFDLKPAMALKTRVVHIKEVDQGVRVSYGGTYQTTSKTKIATLPIGYADGFSRVLSDRAQVIVDGALVPIIGRICMDQCMIDVTDVNTIHVGDEVTVIGEAGGLQAPVENLAKITNTINYEILCVIGKRIPRIYYQGGKITKILNFLM